MKKYKRITKKVHKTQGTLLTSVRRTEDRQGNTNKVHTQKMNLMILQQEDGVATADFRKTVKSSYMAQNPSLARCEHSK